VGVESYRDPVPVHRSEIFDARTDYFGFGIGPELNDGLLAEVALNFFDFVADVDAK
jgi:hypothetical protein